MAGSLVALAEEPALWLPPAPGQERVEGRGFSLVARSPSAWVQRLRLGDGEVEETVEEVRALVRARGLPEAVWWVGELSTPAGLAERLGALGLVPGDPPRLTSLAIERAPAASATVEVRRAERFDEFLQALEIDWEAFAVAPEERARRREEALEAWPLLLADGTTSTYLALERGEPVGFARAVFTPDAALLMGGATLPHARGRGVYSSTVLARWREAVERGVPRLAVSAGPLSTPVLERLGFARLGSVRLLADRL